MSKNFDGRQPEIDALKEKIAGGSPREVIMLKTELQLMVEQRETLWKEIDALKAENERLRRNAGRYSWLRDPKTDVGLVIDKVVSEIPTSSNGGGGYRVYEYRAGEELDAAIDAAMKAPSMRVPPDTKGEWE